MRSRGSMMGVGFAQGRLDSLIRFPVGPPLSVPFRRISADVEEASMQGWVESSSTYGRSIRQNASPDASL
jgi:hypothetical protein